MCSKSSFLFVTNIIMDSEYLKQDSNINSNLYSNSKLDKRTFELNLTNKSNNMLERDVLFNENSRTKEDRYNSKTQCEITGDKVKLSKIDQGMPLRSQFNPKKVDFDIQKSYNKYLDFDIFEDDAPNTLDVSYFDPNSDKICDFNEIQPTIFNKSDPIQTTSAVFNDFTWYMLENIRNLLATSTFYCTFGITTSLIYLYLISKGDTEIEIKNYLNLSEKTIMVEGLTEIIKYVNKSECFDYKNIILVNKKFNLNKTTYNTLLDIIQIDSKNAEYEANKLNKYLHGIYGNILGNIFKKEHMQNLDISSISVGILRTVWKQPFDKIITNKFYIDTNISIPINMMYSVGKTFNYFEDDDNQIIESKMYDGVLSMGIVLSKKFNKKVPSMTLQNYEIYIQNMKPTILDEVMIPKFTHNSKMRFNSIFRKSGLVNIFHKLEIPDLIDDHLALSDFTQNITVIIDEKFNSSKTNDKYINAINSNRKFIANKPLIYYFRCIATNTIIIAGQFLGK
jgi:serine protease inhibitor